MCRHVRSDTGDQRVENGLPASGGLLVNGLQLVAAHRIT